MSDSLPRAAWDAGGNGNWFADIGGARYCVASVVTRGGPFSVFRNGIEIAGPACLSGPAGYKTVEAAKRYAEWHADANSGKE